MTLRTFFTDFNNEVVFYGVLFKLIITDELNSGSKSFQAGNLPGLTVVVSREGAIISIGKQLAVRETANPRLTGSRFG